MEKKHEKSHKIIVNPIRPASIEKGYCNNNYAFFIFGNIHTLTLEL